ncbi:unnamed protein product, partial [Arabidopsis halleri]
MVHGRIIAGQRFQFVFPSEESMETVLWRGPWTFVDRMMILQRWTSLMIPPLLSIIPFWIQVRGIPLQFLNDNVVTHIGRAMTLITTQKQHRGEFYDVCGMLTQDTGNCLIQNGGLENREDTEDNQIVGNPGVHIEEIFEAEENNNEVQENGVLT